MLTNEYQNYISAEFADQLLTQYSRKRMRSNKKNYCKNICTQFQIRDNTHLPFSIYIEMFPEKL